MDNNWLNDLIRYGLVKLASIRLEGCPADDVIELTALTWQEAITDGMAWDQARDEPRIRAAFVILAKTRDKWPAPKHFLAAIPPVEVKAIGYERKPASPEVAESNIRKLREMTGVYHDVYRDRKMPTAGGVA